VSAACLILKHDRFAIPFTLATTLGLAAVALRGDPDMQVLTPADVSAGLPAAAAARALLGKSGAAALLILLFLAVTSATSAELIAVSSILTYDVYKRYINPDATEAQILRMGHWMVAFFAVVMGIFGLIFFYIGVSMGWLYTFMGVILGSAVVPIALCVTWSKANKWGCIGGSIAGFFAGLIAWLVTTSTLNGGVINVVTSGGDYEMLAGNLASIGIGGIVATAASYIWPDDYDFVSTRAINTSGGHSGNEKEAEPRGDDYGDKKEPSSPYVQSINEEDSELDPVALEKAYKFAARSSVILTLIYLIVIPLPLFFAHTIYGVRGLTAWVVIGILWTFCSAFTVVIYPLYESRVAIMQIFRGMVKDVFARGSGKHDSSPPVSSSA